MTSISDMQRGKPTKPAKKVASGKDMSGQKSGKKPGTFTGADDPRRARGPKPGAPNAGRPTDAFKALMRELANDEVAVANLRYILTTAGPHEDFLKALAHVTDRGYGKAQQHVDVTTSGQSIAEILRKGRDRVARMKAESEARG